RSPIESGTGPAAIAAVDTTSAAHCRTDAKKRACTRRTRSFTRGNAVSESFASGELQSLVEHRVRARGLRHEEAITERNYFLDVVGFHVRMTAGNVVLLARGDD